MTVHYVVPNMAQNDRFAYVVGCSRKKLTIYCSVIDGGYICVSRYGSWRGLVME